MSYEDKYKIRYGHPGTGWDDHRRLDSVRKAVLELKIRREMWWNRLRGERWMVAD